MSDLEPGSELQNTYRVVRLIGRGAMGQVYEVRHARLSGRYALKLLSDEAAKDPEFLHRFRREAQIVSGLHHPHIVQVIDFDQNADGRPYLVMELLDGEDLAVRLDREGPLPLSRVVTIITQIASALHTAHRHGVIHRDLKPENVLLMRADDPEEGSDFAKLVDFGISKVKNSTMRLTQERTLIGTPHYMSPEQVRFMEVDERTDQFALGAIAYELLSGELAFGGDNVVTVVYHVAHGEPPRLANPAGWIHPAVDAVLRRALAKRPTDRFATVTEFAAAFAEAARGVEGGAVLRQPRPAAATRRMRSQVAAVTRRRPAPRPALAAAVVLAVAATATIWSMTRPPQAPGMNRGAAALKPATVVVQPPPTPPAPAPTPASIAPAAPAPWPTVAPATAEPDPSAKAARRPPRRHGTGKAEDRLYNEL